MLGKRGDQLLACFRLHTGPNIEPGSAEPSEAASVNAWVWVSDTHHDPPDARINYRIATGRRAPVVGARLHGDVEHPATGLSSSFPQRDDLGVRLAGSTVEAPPDHFSPFDHHGTDRWVWTGPADSLSSKPDCQPHEGSVGRHGCFFLRPLRATLRGRARRSLINS
jgi:hypothetical protein